MVKYNQKFYFSAYFYIFLCGVTSGLPFLLVHTTLSAWLVDCEFTRTTIGHLIILTIPYTLKGLWAPFFQRNTVPYLEKYFGFHKSWIFLLQKLLFVSFLILSTISPRQNILFFSCSIFCISILSACQDILYESFRTKLIQSLKLLYGETFSVLGYRVGMVCSGAGVLYLAHYFGWYKSYLIIAVILFVISYLLLLIPISLKKERDKKTILEGSFSYSFKKAISSFSLSRVSLPIIFAFLFFHKIPDTVLQVMNIPFLKDIGFSNIDIASYAKTFGVLCMILGGLIGGVCLRYLKLFPSLKLGLIFQLISCAMFIIQSNLGLNYTCLTITMILENITSGMNQVFIIALFTYYCRGSFAMIQLALLSSLSSCSRISISVFSGFLSDICPNWSSFYILVLFGSLPCFLIIKYLSEFVENKQGVKLQF